MSEDYHGQSTKLHAAIGANVTMIQQKARLDAGDEIAVIPFTDYAQVLCPMQPIGGRLEVVIAAIQSLSSDGGTDINRALALARDEAFDWSRQNLVRRIVLLTDGHSSHEAAGTAQDLKNRGVVIDCIGIGPDPSAVNEELLRQMASVIGGQSRYPLHPGFADAHPTLHGSGQQDGPALRTKSS